MPVCTSSTMKKHSCLVRDRSQGLQERGAEVVVAALGLDGLDDDGRDVVRVVREGLLHLLQRALLGRGHVALHLRRDREAQLGILDARPAELGEEVGLLGIGVGERERVAAAAVEGLAEVQDLLSLVAGYAARAVAPGLPVEGDLQRVLDGEAPPSMKNA